MGDGITDLLNLVHRTRINNSDNTVTLGEVQEYLKGAFDTNGDGRIDNVDKFDTNGNGVIDSGDDSIRIQELRSMAYANLSSITDPVLRSQLRQAQAALRLVLQQTSPSQPPHPIHSTNPLFGNGLIRNPYELSDSNENQRWSHTRKSFQGQTIEINRDRAIGLVTNMITRDPSAAVDEQTRRIVFELWRNEDYIGGQRRQVFRVEEMKGVLDYMNTLSGDAHDTSTERGRFFTSFKRSMADYISDSRNNLNQQFVMDSFLQMLQSTDFSADQENRELGQFIKDLTIGIAENSNYFKNKTPAPGATDAVIGNYDNTKDGGIFGSLALIRHNNSRFEFIEHQVASPINKTRYVFAGTAPTAVLPPPGGAGGGTGLLQAPVVPALPVPKPPVVITPQALPTPAPVAPAPPPNPRAAEIAKAQGVLNSSPVAGKLYPGRQVYTGGYGFVCDKNTRNLYYLAPGAQYWRSFNPKDNGFYQVNGVSGNATVRPISLATSIPTLAPVPAATPPVPVATPPAPVATPSVPVATPPAPVATPSVPVATPLVPVATPPAPAVTPPTPIPPVTPKPPRQSPDVLSLEDSGDVRYPVLHSVFTNQVQVKTSKVSYPNYPPNNPGEGDLGKFVRSKRADCYKEYKYGSEYFVEIAREVARGKGRISIEAAALKADKTINKGSLEHSPRYRLSSKTDHEEVKGFEVLFVVGSYCGDTQKTCFRLDGEVTRDTVIGTYGDKCKKFEILDDPTQEQFERALKARAESARRNRRKLYIFYSGHGSDKGPQRGVSVRNRGKQGSTEFEYGLDRFIRTKPTETYMKEQYIKYLNDVETITIIDACYSGAAVTATNPEEHKKYFASLT